MEQIEHITSDDDLKKYRTETPNIVDDLDLSPHAFRVYSHYRRACGANSKPCTQSTRTIAGICKMSVGKVSEAKKELVTAGLIKITESTGKLGVQHSVTVCNIWSINFAYFDKQITLEEAKDKIRGVVHNMNGGVQNMNDQRSQYELKKEPIQERTIEESLSAIADVATVSSDTVTVTVITPKPKKPKVKEPVSPLRQRNPDKTPNPYTCAVAFFWSGKPYTEWTASERKADGFRFNKLFAIDSAMQALYDEVGGFTPEQLERALQTWVDRHPVTPLESRPRETKLVSNIGGIIKQIVNTDKHRIVKVGANLSALIADATPPHTDWREHAKIAQELHKEKQSNGQ